jgi:tRNA pseudouridine38-40 synthase
MRACLTLEYFGPAFHGLQRQDRLLTVQGVLEAALYSLCGQALTVHAAGRTDAGVHALGQVVHVDLPRSYPPHVLRNGLNALMRPHPVAVLAATEVPPDFHARFSARSRHYRYVIINRPAPLTVEAGRAWHVPTALDVPAMQAAAQLLVGQHDFSSFRASSCQARSPVRTLERLDVVPEGEQVLVLASSRSFLHHQVRNMVGSLVQVGKGRWTPADIQNALAARRRCAGGQTAPAEGLYFVAVEYTEIV